MSILLRTKNQKIEIYQNIESQFASQFANRFYGFDENLQLLADGLHDSAVNLNLVRDTMNTVNNMMDISLNNINMDIQLQLLT